MFQADLSTEQVAIQMARSEELAGELLTQYAMEQTRGALLRDRLRCYAQSEEARSRLAHLGELLIEASK